MSEDKNLTGKVGGKKLFIIGTSSIVGPWLILTSQWIGYTGASVILAFALCGLLCIPIALCYGELAGMFKTRGGTYEYVRTAYNREAGYWISWTTMFTYIVLICFQIICVTMLVQFIVGLEFSQALIIGIAIALMIVMTLLNTRDLSIATTVQTLLFFVLVIIGFLFVACFFLNDAWSVGNIGPFFQEGMSGYNEIIGMDAGFLLAIAALVTMFFGFELIPQFASEADYPPNKYWKLMAGGIIFVIIFDSIICLAEIGMTSLDPSMSTYEYISSLYGSNGMVSAIFAAAYVGDWLKWLIVAANFAAMGCCLIGFWMGATRILHAMGSAGSLPAMFSRTNKQGMPSVGNYFVLIMVFILTMIALSGPAWINATFSLMAMGVGFTYLGVSLSYLKLLKTYPHADRPWSAPGKAVMGYIAVASSLFMTIMMIWTVVKAALNGDPIMAIMAIVFFVIIGVMRYFMKKDEKKNPERYVEEPILLSKEDAVSMEAGEMVTEVPAELNK
ncbi:APC family permease [Candidatus Methanomassiliicoccus intestinalis]|uniref:APC family permease n=1 Tax=Candidatus Methanomassiliicoccus intestinalis TaxID=1406512 RepID=UPI0037DC2067